MFEYATKFFKKSSASVIRWSGAGTAKNAAQYFCSVTKKLFKNEQDEKASFSEALEQYNITEQDLINKHRFLLKQCVFYLICAVLVFFYLCYQIRLSEFFIAFLSGLIVCLLFAFAFRSHFWAYQISQRKLGCNFQEWWQAVRSGEQ